MCGEPSKGSTAARNDSPQTEASPSVDPHWSISSLTRLLNRVRPGHLIEPTVLREVALPESFCLMPAQTCSRRGPSERPPARERKSFCPSKPDAERGQRPPKALFGRGSASAQRPPRQAERWQLPKAVFFNPGPSIFPERRTPLRMCPARLVRIEGFGLDDRL